MDLEEVAEALSVSKSTVQAMAAQGNGFPRPRKISSKRVGWLVREVMEWADGRPVSDLLPPPNTGAKKPRAGGAQSQQDASCSR
ncbi:helix-turn-helix transcriptional regulator [Laribacter hongkongensis]